MTHELETTLLNSKVSKYDGWYHESKHFDIIKVIDSENYIKVYGGEQDEDGDYDCVYIPKSIINTLIKEGKCDYDYEIDHCTITNKFTLETIVSEKDLFAAGLKDALIRVSSILREGDTIKIENGKVKLYGPTNQLYFFTSVIKK